MGDIHTPFIPPHPPPPPHTHTHTHTQNPTSPGSDLPFTVPYPPLKEDDKSSNKKKKEEKGEKSHKKQGPRQPKPPDEPRYHVLHRDDLSMQDFTNSRESTVVRRPRELVVTVELPNVVRVWGVRVWRGGVCVMRWSCSPGLGCGCRVGYL